MTTVESFSTELYDQGLVTAVIRPAAVIPQLAANAIVVELSVRDVRHDGLWDVATTAWTRYDRPWATPTQPGSAVPVGAIHVTYGAPTRYDITLHRVTITERGATMGWTVAALCDEALLPAHLTLAECPRAQLTTPPSPFRW